MDTDSEAEGETAQAASGVGANNSQQRGRAAGLEVMEVDIATEEKENNAAERGRKEERREEVSGAQPTPAAQQKSREELLSLIHI